MEGKEERAMDEDESHKNSQTEKGTGESNRQEHHSQTPLLRSEGGSDTEDDKKEDREEQTSGTVWGHEHLPRSVYGNNPVTGDNDHYHHRSG